MVHSWQVIETRSPIHTWPSPVGSSTQCMILKTSRTFETKRSRNSENQFYRHKCIVIWYYFDRRHSVKKVSVAFSSARLV